MLVPVLIVLALAGCVDSTSREEGGSDSGRIRLVEAIYRYDFNTSLTVGGPIGGFNWPSPVANATLYPMQDRLDHVLPTGTCILVRELVYRQGDGPVVYEEVLECAARSQVHATNPDGWPIAASMLEDTVATAFTETSVMLLHPEDHPWIVEMTGERYVFGHEDPRYPGNLTQLLLPYNGTVTWVYHGSVDWARATQRQDPQSITDRAEALIPGPEP